MLDGHIHIIGACGRAIGGLAVDLQDRGLSISASDGLCQAPMDAFLKDRGLHITEGFAARNIPAKTTMVVAAASIRADNVEIQAAKRRKIPVLHMAEFLRDHLLNHKMRIVVAGTNGKTTTASMLAWILECAGKHPDYLIGAPSPLFPNTVRFKGKKLAVLEGDEYPATPESGIPKFHFYNPHLLLLTNVLHDHAEIYADETAVVQEFIKLTTTMPPSGKILVSASCPNALRTAKQSPAAWEKVSLRGLRVLKDGMSFHLGEQRYFLPMFGRMNAQNAALAARAALEVGVPSETIAAALALFQPVPGRMQTLLDSPGAALVIDENYHPAALRENIAALRMRYPHRRIVVALQPRYTGGRSGFQSATLPAALATADVVILSRPFDLKPFPNGKFSSRSVLAKLRTLGRQTHFIRSLRGLNKFVPRVLRHGDVLFVSLPSGCEFITQPLTETLRKLTHA
jgi:UDP-N-acetylmuramate: L-alanyl-gamma-D-glutamyl-meso-diaminopimelate ligase